VITLATGAKIVVAETPERVVSEVRAYRVDILAGALRRRHELRADGTAPQGRRTEASASHPHVRLAHSSDQSQSSAQA
jgi:hypothetical protein